MQSAYMHDCTKKKKNENPDLLYRRFKGGDDIFDTKTLTFAITVSNLSPWVINLLFRIIESGSGYFKQQILALLFGHHSQLVSHKICSHFAISWGFVYLVKQSRSLQHEAFHDDKTNLESSLKKTTGATIGYNVRVADNNLRYNLRLPWKKKKKRNLS